MLFRKKKEPIEFEVVERGPPVLPVLSPPTTPLYAERANGTGSQSKAPIVSNVPHSFHKPFKTATSIRRQSSAPSVTSLYIHSSTQNYNIPMPKSPSSRAIKRQRQLLNYNVLLVGARKSGKTSFHRMLVETENPNNAIPSTSRQGYTPTTETHELTLEVGLADDKTKLTLIDTPGFDLCCHATQEAELCISRTLRLLEQRFWDSLNEETQVVRTASKAKDAHIHAVLYFIKPDAFLPDNEESQDDRSPTQNTSFIELDAEDADGDNSIKYKLRQAEVDFIQRLSRRANVVPILACSDHLSTLELEGAKRAVMKQLIQAGLVCPELRNGDTASSSKDRPIPTAVTLPKSESMPEVSLDRSLEDSQKIVRTRSRSISRRRRTLAHSDAVLSAMSVATNLPSRLPFALVSPDWPVDPKLPDSGAKFLRKYRWGAIDCVEQTDFNLLKEVLFQTHVRALRDSTNTLYETFRTEKMLLAQKGIK